MNPRQPAFVIYLSSFLLISSVFSSAAAEPLPLPDSGLLMRENRPPAAPPKPQAEEVISNPDIAKPAMSPADDLRMTVKKFRFSGNRQFNDAELTPLLNTYSGHEIGFKDLEAAAQRISQYYHAAGFFLASAYLPQQAIKNGEVEIAVLEGRLDASHLTSDVIEAVSPLRINHAVLQDFLATYPEGELLTVEELNNLSLLINDLPGISSKIVLMPGTKIGSSALRLKVKEEPLLKGYALTDNHGLYSTGYYRFDGGIHLNDALGLGDQLNLRVQTTESGNVVSGAADYTMPINGYGTRLAVNFSELHYNLGRIFTPLQAQGLARTVGISLNHPFWLAREGRLTGSAHYEHRWMFDNVALNSSYNHRELDVVNFALSGNYYDQLLAAGGLTQAYLGVSAGEVRFNHKDAFNNDQSSGLHSNGGYHKFVWQLNRTQNIVEDFSLFANFQGQIASKNLDTSEQISLGGPQAIRAYPVGEGSADEGWLFNGEARYHLPNIAPVPGYLQLVGFIDSGFSRINARPLAGDLHNSQHLTGYGFGLNLLEAVGFNVRTSVAWRDIKKQPTSDATAHGPMLYFQLSKSF
jgi:hemolysin activation/secretion protein